VQAVILDNNWIWFENITDIEDTILFNEFSVSVDKIYIDSNQMGQWDGIYRKYNRAKKRMARPLLSLLKQVCKRRELPLVIDDRRGPWEVSITPQEDITANFLPGIILDDYQVNGIRKAALPGCECGIFDVPTGGGKTELLAGICKAINCPTIILADQTVVVDQIKERLELREVGGEIGMFYAGRRPNGQAIVVGSISSLTAPAKPPEPPTRKPEEKDAAWAKRLEKWEIALKGWKTRRKNVKFLKEYVKRAEMLIVDECDRATSDPYKNVFRNLFRGRRRFGFSGTVFDPSKVVERLELQESLGSVIYKVERSELERLGRIIPCEYRMIPYGMEGSIHESSTYDIAYNEHIVRSPRYHNNLISLCKLLDKDNDGTLLLVDREELGLALKALADQVGIPAEYVYGKTPQSKRKKIFEAFEKREIRLLIGGKIINRGFDLKGGCENMILAVAGKLQSEMLQKIGRALRRNKYGLSHIYDSLFRCNKYLWDHSKEHLRTMVNAGYKCVIAFPGGLLDGKEFVEKRFRIPKEYLQKKVTVQENNTGGA